MHTKNTNPGISSSNQSKYWFEEGTLTLKVQDTRFRLHHSLLSRHSELFKTISTTQVARSTVVLTVSHDKSNEGDGAYHLIVKEAVSVSDFELLLAHLYHDEPLSRTSSFNRLASLLRVSGDKQLQFPRFHALARSLLEGVMPSEPLLIAPEDFSLYAALDVAGRYGFKAARKTILYWLVTTHPFEEDHSITVRQEPDSIMPESLTLHNSTISLHDRKLCEILFERIIGHFTPILYTPATASHMPCTDRFADLWMPYVIQPSLEDDGVYKPLETLERIKNIDWVKEGLCASCVAEKNGEWTEEQVLIWQRLDSWIDAHTESGD